MDCLALVTSVVSQISDPAFVQTTQHQWLFVNDAFCKLAGYAAADLLKQPQSIWPDDASHTLQTAISHLQATQTASVVSLPMQLAQGQQPVTVQLSLLPQASTPLILGLIKPIEPPALPTLNQGQPSLEQLQLLVKQAPVAIAMLDTDMRYLITSQRWLEDYGLSDRDLTGQSHYDVFPTIPDRWKAVHQRCLAGAVESCEEDPFFRENGKTDWIKWEVRPWYNAAGQIGGVVMLTEIITGRKQAEMGLLQFNLQLENKVSQRTAELTAANEMLLCEVRQRKQNEDCFQLLAERTGQLIYDYDLTTGGITWAGAIQKITGCPPQEFQAVDIATWEARIHPDDRQQALALLDQAMQNKAKYQVEYRFCQKDGTYIYIEDSGIFLTDEANEVHRMLGTMNNISDRKQAEIKLQNSEQLLRTVMNTLPQSIFWKDCDSVYLGCNRSFAQDAGLMDPNSVVGKTDYDLPWTQEEADAFRICDRRVIKTNQPELQIIEPQRQADGKQAWLITNKVPLHDANGNTIGILGTYEDITARKAIETALRDREQFLRSVYEGSENPIFVVDVLENGKLRFVDINPAAERALQISRDQLKQRSPRPQIQPHYQRCLVLGQAVSYEECLTLHGEKTWWFTTLNPLKDEANQVYRIVGTTLNITDRQKIEEALRQSEQRFRDVSEAAGEYLWEISADGIYTFVTDKAKAVKGYAASELLGHSLFDFMPLEDVATVKTLLAQASEQKSSFTLEHRNLAPNGEIVWERVSGLPLLNQSGQFIGFRGAGLSITERKRTEQALQEQAQLSEFRAEIDSILAREEQLKTMLQRCCEVIVQRLAAAFARLWTLNPEDNVLELQASAGWYTHLDGGHSRIPVGQFKIGLIAAERRPHLTNDVLSDPHVSDKAWAKRTGMVAFAGYPLIVEDELLGVVAVFAQHPLSNSVLEILSFIVTELALGIKRKQAERSLVQSEARFRQQTQELEQTVLELQRTQMQLIQSEKMSSLGELVAGLAHEINNPVSFIFGNLVHAKGYAHDLLRLVQLYQTHYPNPAAAIQQEIATIELDFLVQDLPKLLSSMEIGAKRIQQIVQSLRIFSRMDEAEVKTVDIHEGIDSTLMILQNRLREQAHRCAIEVIKRYDALPTVECYPGQLNQVFMNLLSNAIDALEEAWQQSQSAAAQAVSYRPTIEICTELTRDQYVVIDVIDNGAGISETVQQRIFNPFFTTKSVGKGTGMGLSISYQIITEKHGGSLTCASTLGKGTRFSIQIPLSQTVSYPLKSS
ncbi:PAS domain-containing sensor histidine kinase [Almyronema epifaneia]|uniref:histidine kinase n=1 Tax=Almyronema epifaneia S1 TaxID=2991925 RepID=A0ABW6ID49_9CYAN